MERRLRPHGANESTGRTRALPLLRRLLGIGPAAVWAGDGHLTCVIQAFEPPQHASCVARGRRLRYDAQEHATVGGGFAALGAVPVRLTEEATVGFLSLVAAS